MSGIHLINLINIPQHKFIHGMGKSRLALKHAKNNTISIQGSNYKLPGGVLNYDKKIELELTKQRGIRHNIKRRKILHYHIH